MEITAKAYPVPATAKRLGMPAQPAGWVLRNVETGEKLNNERYATEDDAMAAAPAVVAAITARVAKAAAARAQRAAELEADAPTARGYHTVRDGAFGDGRVYHDRPGATQYDDGSGRYRVQIWDNA